MLTATCLTGFTARYTQAAEQQKLLLHPLFFLSSVKFILIARKLFDTQYIH